MSSNRDSGAKFDRKIDSLQAVIPEQPGVLYEVLIGYNDYCYGDGISSDFIISERSTFYCETDAIMHAVEMLPFHQEYSQAHIVRYNDAPGGEKFYITQGDFVEVPLGGRWLEDDTYEKYVTMDQGMAYAELVAGELS